LPGRHTDASATGGGARRLGGHRCSGLAASVDVVAWPPIAGRLSLALVYPMGLIWFTNLNPDDGDGLVILILTMMAGG